MKYFSLLFLVFSISSYGQIEFKEGYFIDNSDHEVTCYIKDLGWQDNPTEFQYRLQVGGEVLTGKIEKIKEFSAPESFKYVRANVQIDRSSQEINKMSESRSPDFEDKVLFLQVMVEGNATLFSYEERNLIRYFYKVETSSIQQLVYKKYLVRNPDYPLDRKVGENNYYQQQLINDLKCGQITVKQAKTVSYAGRSLKKFFTSYNLCMDSDYKPLASEKRENNIDLSIKAGASIASISVSSPTSPNRNAEFDQNVNFRIGAEAEFFLPYKQGKWSILIEPTFQQYSADETLSVTNITDGILVAKVDYRSVELPVGLRYYSFLSESVKLFANFHIVYDFNEGSTLEYYRSNGDLFESFESLNYLNFGLGGGLKLLETISLECRVYTQRDVNRGPTGPKIPYRNLSLIFGYTLF